MSEDNWKLNWEDEMKRPDVSNTLEHVVMLPCTHTNAKSAGDLMDCRECGTSLNNDGTYSRKYNIESINKWKGLAT
tara:strand:+ start:575 stop:802 length:228 start_codon:yes stop_codon:yes gene_type:complete